MGPLATDVQTVVIPGASHWVRPRKAPEELLDALTTFLTPFGAAVIDRRPMRTATRSACSRD